MISHPEAFADWVKQDSPKPAKRHKAPPGECKLCDEERERRSDFHPSHDASDRCESGKRIHCSCDTCF